MTFLFEISEMQLIQKDDKKYEKRKIVPNVTTPLANYFYVSVKHE